MAGMNTQGTRIVPTAQLLADASTGALAAVLVMSTAAPTARAASSPYPSVSYTTTGQSVFRIPNTATYLRITAVGGTGGTADDNITAGGSGASVSATFRVGARRLQADNPLYVEVGHNGHHPTQIGTEAPGGGGGGASDVRLCPEEFDPVGTPYCMATLNPSVWNFESLQSRLLVAAGGGGGGSTGIAAFFPMPGGTGGAAAQAGKDGAITGPGGAGGDPGSATSGGLGGTAGKGGPRAATGVFGLCGAGDKAIDLVGGGRGRDGWYGGRAGGDGYIIDNSDYAGGGGSN